MRLHIEREEEELGLRMKKDHQHKRRKFSSARVRISDNDVSPLCFAYMDGQTLKNFPFLFYFFLELYVHKKILKTNLFPIKILLCN